MSPWRIARVLLVLSPLLALAGVAGWYVTRQFDAGPPPRSLAGRLVVLVSFDQMRGDYLDRWSTVFGDDGFELAKKNGVWYSNAHLPYACTSTGPGHASIATGAPPAVHGIVENGWFERAKGKTVYCADGDRPYERVPPNPSSTERVKGGGGMAPDRLLAPTIGDALLKATDGKGRVVSLAVKDRAAVLMGGKQPTACYCFDTAAGEFHTSAYYRDKPHPWVDQFNKSGAADHWFTTPWDRLGSASAYERLAGPDDVPGEAKGPDQGVTFPHLLNKNQTAPGGKYYAALECSPFGNVLLWEFAKAAIEAENLGRGEAPDLLCLGFSCNDMIGHTWGPDSQEVLDVTARSDRLLAEMTKHLTATIGPGRFAVVVTADHGVCPLPEVAVQSHPDADRFSPAAEFAPLGEVLDHTFGKQDVSPGRWVERNDFPWLYLNRKLADAQGVPPAAVEEFAAQWVGNRPHCVAAYPRAVMAGPPLANDPVGRSVQLSYHPDRCGDVFEVLRPYCLPTGKPSSGTTHGSPHPYDTHVPVLAFGVGVPQAGRRDVKANALLVAPIVCRALGIDPPAGATEKLPAEWDAVGPTP